MLIHNKDDIEFVTEFSCLLGHPVHAKMPMPDTHWYPKKLYLIKYELDINVCNFKADYFQLISSTLLIR